MRRSIRFAYVAVWAGLAVPVASGPSEAQSLSEAQSVSSLSEARPLAETQSPSANPSLSEALAGPANKAAEEGSWKTMTAPASVAAAQSDQWPAKIVVAKSKIADPKQVAAKAAPLPQPPFGLHGPELAGKGHAMKGIASFYGKGARTATGEAFNPRDMTAAHKTLPFGTRVRVTRVDSGHSVIVRINDRGPFKPGRVIDLSTKAAEDLGITAQGLAAVQLEVLDREATQRAENVAQRSERR